MQWDHLYISHNQQESLQLFNRKLNVGLFNCILVCGLFFISACTENNYNSSHVTNQSLDISVQIKKVKVAEYIIVLKEGINITTALSRLKIYDTHLVKDLKRGRYLISLKNNPGIEQLQKDITGSEYIKFIQPNFRYKSQ